MHWFQKHFVVRSEVLTKLPKSSSSFCEGGHIHVHIYICFRDGAFWHNSKMPQPWFFKPAGAWPDFKKGTNIRLGKTDEIGSPGETGKPVLCLPVLTVTVTTGLLPRQITEQTNNCYHKHLWQANTCDRLWLTRVPHVHQLQLHCSRCLESWGKLPASVEILITERPKL